MAFSNLGNEFVWFVARVVDIEDPEKLGRMKIRVIHGQTGELGKTVDSFGVEDKDLLWAYSISSIQSASLHWTKVADKNHPLEGFNTPEWIGAVGISPTGIAVGTYVYGFYLDGREQNIPMVFGTYHKKSIHPEPPSQSKTNRMLQLRGPVPPPPPDYYNDVAPLARGVDDVGKSGQTLPKHKYFTNKLWTNTTSYKNIGTVDEMPSGYGTQYPYNTTYTTKSGHAIELDDTPGFERVHIWHRSGSYEEISNGRVGIPDPNRDYPHDGPNKYVYVTASGEPEPDYIGRRSLKTVDSFFETTVKDKNQLIGRDRNVEVGKNETVKIGNVYHWTVGYSAPPEHPMVNRINDGKTGYHSGGIGAANAFFDVANNLITTAANNRVLTIGGGPASERRLAPDDVGNSYTDIANNSVIAIANNSVTAIANNSVITVGKDGTIEIGDNATVKIGKNSTVSIGGDSQVSVSGNTRLSINGNLTISAKNMSLSARDSMSLSAGKSMSLGAPSFSAPC